MGLLIKSLGWLLSLTALAAVGLALLLFMDGRPLVPEARILTGAERSWAKQWLRAARPRGMKDGERTTLSLSQEEANILGTYLINQLGQGRVAIRLENNRARGAASLGLPWDPRESFINLEMVLTEAAGIPRIESARLGGLALPSGLVQSLADRLTGAVDQSRLLEHVDLKPGLMLLTYEWHRNAIDNLGSGLLTAQERDRLLHYQSVIARDGAKHSAGQPLQLTDLLSKLLSEAYHRGPGSDPVQENRAAILALAAYVNRRAIRLPQTTSGQPQTDQEIPSGFHPVLLRGRRDLGMHFMTSAALAAQGGNILSDLVGLYKEVSDAHGGSGFSFADLAADRAGTRFAQLATSGRGDALGLQIFARRRLSEDDFMPPISGLPEGLNRNAFNAAFGNTKSPAYQRLLDHIERRIDSTTLYRTVQN